MLSPMTPLPMTKQIVRCDITDEFLDAEEDVIYSVTVLKRDSDKNGKRRLMKFDFDASHEGFSRTILSALEGKKVLNRWQIYVPPTKEEKADGQKGHWEKIE